MPKAKIVWSEQAKLDLKGIRRRIARNAPRTATEFVQKLGKSVGLLRSFPELGGLLSDIQTSTYRELIKGNYRIIYRVLGNTVFIVTVRHAARLLGEEFLDE